MPHLLARANEAVLVAQWLRQERRALRLEAAIRAGKTREAIVRATGTVADGQSRETVEPDGSA
jgi:hypothetical protein